MLPKGSNLSYSNFHLKIFRDLHAEEKIKITDVNDIRRSISFFAWLGAYPFYLLFQVPYEVPIAALGIVQYSYSLQRKEHALKRRQLQNRHCALKSTKEVISRRVDIFLFFYLSWTSSKKEAFILKIYNRAF